MLTRHGDVAVTEGLGAGMIYLLRKSLSYFPTLVFLLAGAAFIAVLKDPGFVSIGVLLFVLYGLPVLVFRLINRFLPIEEGFSYIPKGHGYHPWHNAYKIQSIYVAFPALETGLRLIPGAYGLWLRLWGSKVGKNVFFAPQVTVMDRSHLDLGDGCFIGNRAYLSPHVVRVKNGKTLVYFKTIKVGRGAFIGFDSRIGPGVTIAPGVSVPAAVDLYPNEQVLSDAHFQKPTPPSATGPSVGRPQAVRQERAVSH